MVLAPSQTVVVTRPRRFDLDYHAANVEAVIGRHCWGARQMARVASRLAVGVALAAACVGVRAADGTKGDWTSTNYDETANRYSPLDQITPGNVTALQQAWSFHIKPAG